MSGLTGGVLIADEQSVLADTELPTLTASGAPAERRRVMRRLLIFADAATISVAMLVASAAAGGVLIGNLVAAGAVSVIGLLAATALGLHRRDANRINRDTLDELPRLFQVAAVCSLGGYACVRAADSHAFVGRAGALAALGLLLTLTSLLAAGRLLARRLARVLVPSERCLVVGAAPIAARIERKLGTNSRLHAEITAVLNDEIADDSLLGALAARLESGSFDRVIIAGGTGVADADLARLTASHAVAVSLLVDGYETFGPCPEVDQLDGITLLGVPQFGLTPNARRLKRVFDLVLAGVVLVLTAPLFGAIAVAIKLTSPGPVFFRQQRVGLSGRVFQIFKFRTMVTDAEARKAELADRNQAAGLFKIAEDPRVTPIGRLLRKYSLDELPQLFNVVRGEMSAVGPRPLVIDEDAAFRGWERQRYAAAPGMTGPWQILGSTRVPVEDMIVLDYLYSVNWSLWRDLKICLRTAGYLLARQSGEHDGTKR